MNSLLTTVWSMWITGVVYILPASTGFPPQINIALQTFIGYLNGFNLLFPIDTLFTCLGLIVAFDLAILTLDLFRMLMNWVRGSGA